MEWAIGRGTSWPNWRDNHGLFGGIFAKIRFAYEVILRSEKRCILVY